MSFLLNVVFPYTKISAWHKVINWSKNIYWEPTMCQNHAWHRAYISGQKRHGSDREGLPQSLEPCRMFGEGITDWGCVWGDWPVSGRVISVILKLRKQSQGRYRRGLWIEWILVIVVTGAVVSMSGCGGDWSEASPRKCGLNDLGGMTRWDFKSPPPPRIIIARVFLIIMATGSHTSSMCYLEHCLF